jgi:hypothetical protein
MSFREDCLDRPLANCAAYQAMFANAVTTADVDNAVRDWFRDGPNSMPLALDPADVPRARDVLRECFNAAVAARGTLLPHELLAVQVAGLLTRDQLVRTWVETEWPCHELAAEHWIDLFRSFDLPQVSSPIEVWRAQLRGQPIGLAWTRDPERAAWFAERSNQMLLMEADILHGSAPRGQVLAVIDGPEQEIVIDPLVRFWM